MIWLTWRQFRGQAVAAVAALIALTVFLVVLGQRIRRSYAAAVDCAGCTASAARGILENEYFNPLLLSGFLVIATPALIGAFWGAPLLARELETGTHRLVWNQSITRARWLAVKLSFVTLAALLVTGALSLLLTWTAAPYDQLLAQRFEELFFPARNIAPLGYAAFAVVLGTVVGLLVRRTVPAMAVTIAALVALQVLMPTVIRPNLQPPVTETVAFTAGTMRVGGGIGISADQITVEGYEPPGAWVVSPAAKLLDASGTPVTSQVFTDCFRVGMGREQVIECIAANDLHFTVAYHPADRYWTFQWLELAAYLLLAGLLAAFAFWRIPHGLA